MNRLTETRIDTFGMKKDVLREPTKTVICNNCQCKECDDCSFKMAVEKLAAYEDSGLEPDAVQYMTQARKNRALEWFESSYGIEAGRMMELAQADKTGRIAVLPCNIGCIVYLLTRNEIIPMRVYSFSCGEHGWCLHTNPENEEDGYSNLALTEQHLGYLWFLTKEEAEKALKERTEK